MLPASTRWRASSHAIRRSVSFSGSLGTEVMGPILRRGRESPVNGPCTLSSSLAPHGAGRRAPNGKSLPGARSEPCPSVGDHGVSLDPSLSIKALLALAAVVLLAFA